VDVRVDRTATYLVALDRDKGPRRRPVEPSIAVKEGRIVAVRGRAGRGVDSAALVSAMPDAATRGVPLEVAAGRRAVPPRFDLAHRALRDRPPPGQSLALPLSVVGPKRDDARASQLGVKEVVATFTTHHPAGQPRVANIHKMADYVRGAVIEPGETFSVNDYV